MKKLPLNENTAVAGKPPKRLAIARPTLNAREVDVKLHRKMINNRSFKETTEEDFKRIQAELKNELGKV